MLDKLISGGQTGVDRAALTVELEREPARIWEVYAVRATRLEPVGLVYLWPVTRYLSI